MKCHVELDRLRVVQVSEGIIYRDNIADLTIIYEPTSWRQFDSLFDGDVEVIATLDGEIYETSGIMRYKFGSNLTITTLEFCQEYLMSIEDAIEESGIEEDLTWLQIIIDVLKLEENMLIEL